VLNDHFSLHGALAYAWTIMYLPMAVIVGVALLRELRHLDPAVLRRLLPGGVMYAIGAILLEPVASHVAEAHGEGSLSVSVVTAVRDGAELAGLTLLISGLLVAVVRSAAGFTFAFEAPDPAPPRRATSVAQP
jgi:hypothetical protein